MPSLWHLVGHYLGGLGGYRPHWLGRFFEAEDHWSVVCLGTPNFCFAGRLKRVPLYIIDQENGRKVHRFREILHFLYLVALFLPFLFVFVLGNLDFGLLIGFVGNLWLWLFLCVRRIRFWPFAAGSNGGVDGIGANPLDWIISASFGVGASMVDFSCSSVGCVALFCP